MFSIQTLAISRSVPRDLNHMLHSTLFSSPKRQNSSEIIFEIFELCFKGDFDNLWMECDVKTDSAAEKMELNHCGRVFDLSYDDVELTFWGLRGIFMSIQRAIASYCAIPMRYGVGNAKGVSWQRDALLVTRRVVRLREDDLMVAQG